LLLEGILKPSRSKKYKKMKIKIYQVDAFTDTLFQGNPAAVCILENPISKVLMQKIAMENNVAETAFISKNEKNHQDFDIKWFTPEVEVDLCGHATLASAYILFHEYGYVNDVINFHSNSGLLTVSKSNDVKENYLKEHGLLTLNFPTSTLDLVKNAPNGLLEALGVTKTTEIVELQKAKDDYLVIFETQKQVQDLNPDFKELKKIEARGIIVSSKGTNEIDFVSRFFCPACGIDEDPVTGSAHTKLIPYWAKKLEKDSLVAQQISPRGGKLWCKLLGKRVEISGKAVLYLKGEIEVN
jgi:PhzF family phenazine biosynthesis protein